MFGLPVLGLRIVGLPNCVDFGLVTCCACFLPGFLGFGSRVYLSGAYSWAVVFSFDDSCFCCLVDFLVH